MKKSEMIDMLIDHEIPFVDYGYVYVRKNGDLVHWGEICHIEHNGKWVKANLYRLPKIYAECCLMSKYYDQWYSPDELDLADQRMINELKAEFGG